MSQPSTETSSVAPAPDPRVAKARRVVKGLAVLVAISMVFALAMAVINMVTDRPAKEVFLGPGADPELVDNPFGPAKPRGPQPGEPRPPQPPGNPGLQTQ